MMLQKINFTLLIILEHHLLKKAEFKVGRNILVDSYKNYMKQANKELNVKSNKSFVKPDTIGGGLPIEIFLIIKMITLEH